MHTKSSRLLVVAALMALTATLGCDSLEFTGTGSAREHMNSGDQEIPDQEGWNSVVRITRRGRLTAILQYGHMQKFAGKHLVLFDGGITVDFYNADGKHTSNLVARKGRMHESTGKVEALQNVVVVSDSGITLMTEHLIWDPEKKRIFSDQFVTIATQEGDTLYGLGFESDQDLKNWTIKKPRGISQKKLDLSELKEPPAPQDDSSKVEQTISDEIE